MIERTFVIKNKLGLHARPAAMLVETASRYNADVMIRKEGMEINGKSIMSVLMLAAEFGSEITLRVKGKQEKEAIEALIALLESKFNEE